MTPSDHDTADLRKDIRELREQMIRFGANQDHSTNAIQSLIASVAKHEQKDDERFARHGEAIAQHGVSLARIQDVFGGSRKIGVAVLSGVAVVLGVLCYVLALVIQMTAKAGGP